MEKIFNFFPLFLRDKSCIQRWFAAITMYSNDNSESYKKKIKKYQFFHKNLLNNSLRCNAHMDQFPQTIIQKKQGYYWNSQFPLPLAPELFSKTPERDEVSFIFCLFLTHYSHPQLAAALHHIHYHFTIIHHCSLRALPWFVRLYRNTIHNEFVSMGFSFNLLHRNFWLHKDTFLWQTLY